MKTAWLYVGWLRRQKTCRIGEVFSLLLSAGERTGEEAFRSSAAQGSWRGGSVFRRRSFTVMVSALLLVTAAAFAAQDATLRLAPGGTNEFTFDTGLLKGKLRAG